MTLNSVSKAPPICVKVNPLVVQHSNNPSSFQSFFYHAFFLLAILRNKSLFFWATNWDVRTHGSTIIFHPLHQTVELFHQVHTICKRDNAVYLQVVGLGKFAHSQMLINSEWWRTKWESSDYMTQHPPIHHPFATPYGLCNWHESASYWMDVAQMWSIEPIVSLFQFLIPTQHWTKVHFVCNDIHSRPRLIRVTIQGYKGTTIPQINRTSILLCEIFLKAW